MYVLYVDESGVPERHPSQTSHYALAGIAIPARTWAAKRAEVERIRAANGFAKSEIHVAWLLRPYPEQQQIPGFDQLPWPRRLQEVNRKRAASLAALTATGDRRRIRQLKVLHRKTRPYAHLTLDERVAVAQNIASLVGSWDDAVLFGEVADKSIRTPFTPDEAAYEQVLTRYEAFLGRARQSGIVAYDMNESVVDRYTVLMARFQEVGGIWRRFTQIEGHPFFVASHMSDMIQVCDVVAYGLRRYCERGETDLLQRFLPRFDRVPGRLVGLRHYRGGRRCRCLICREPRHRSPAPTGRAERNAG